MPAQFINSSFNFEDGETVPPHKNGWAGGVVRNPALWHLNGLDTFEMETYALASNIETEDAVQLLAGAARRAIEILQPSSRAGSIQDQVIVVSPQA